MDGGRGRDAAPLFAATRYAGARASLSCADPGTRGGLGGGPAGWAGDLRRGSRPGRCLETFTSPCTLVAAREAEVEGALCRAHLRGGGHAPWGHRTRAWGDAGLHWGFEGATGQRLLGQRFTALRGGAAVYGESLRPERRDVTLDGRCRLRAWDYRHRPYRHKGKTRTRGGVVGAGCGFAPGLAHRLAQLSGAARARHLAALGAGQGGGGFPADRALARPPGRNEGARRYVPARTCRGEARITGDKSVIGKRGILPFGQ